MLKEKRIYLIRHGETDFNLKGIVQGSGVDTSLNDTGRKQAQAFFEHYKHIPFKKIYTSALKRTGESVQKFIDLGIPYEHYSGFNEISWGANDGKIVSSADHSYYSEMLDSWKKGEVDKSIDGGESPLDVQARQKPAMDIVMSRDEEDCILICMHGRAMRILLSTLLHGDLNHMDKYAHQNLCLYEIVYADGKFALAEFNKTNHLITLK